MKTYVLAQKDDRIELVKAVFVQLHVGRVFSRFPPGTTSLNKQEEWTIIRIFDEDIQARMHVMDQLIGFTKLSRRYNKA